MLEKIYKILKELRIVAFIERYFSLSWAKTYDMICYWVIKGPLLTLFLCTLIFAIINVILHSYLERKVFALAQKREGPTFNGLFGTLQAVLDGLKLVLKEPAYSGQSNQFLTIFGLSHLFVCYIIALMFVPFSPNYLFIFFTDLNLLVIFALSSMALHSFLYVSWAHTNKYSQLGGLRTVAQLLSYDIALGILILTIAIIPESLSFFSIMHAQNSYYGFILHPLPTILFIICILAELQRIPFDLKEAESELVSGALTEIPSIYFALYSAVEFIAMLIWSNIFIICFLGGFNDPIINWIYDTSDMEGVPMIIVFLLYMFKLLSFMLFLLHIRATFARFRFDQLLQMGWQIIVPLALLCFIDTILFHFFFCI